MRTQWIKADIDEPIEVHEMPEKFFFNDQWDEINKFIGGDFEFVTVLYEGKPRYMLCNEIGALSNMPINPRATNIYHNAQVKPRCKADGIRYIPKNYSQIHGDVILVEEQMT